MVTIVIYLLIVKKSLDLTPKILNLKHVYPTYLGNISSDFNQAERKLTGLKGYVYDFSVDYNAIAVDDILDIHKYLMKKNNII